MATGTEKREKVMTMRKRRRATATNMEKSTIMERRAGLTTTIMIMKEATSTTIITDQRVMSTNMIISSASFRGIVRQPPKITISPMNIKKGDLLLSQRYLVTITVKSGMLIQLLQSSSVTLRNP